MRVETEEETIVYKTSQDQHKQHPKRSAGAGVLEQRGENESAVGR